MVKANLKTIFRYTLKIFKDINYLQVFSASYFLINTIVKDQEEYNILQSNIKPLVVKAYQNVVQNELVWRGQWCHMTIEQVKLRILVTGCHSSVLKAEAKHETIMHSTLNWKTIALVALVHNWFISYI